MLQGLKKSGKLRFRARRPIPSRRKLKEKGKYNSFLPNFRPSSLTARHSMLEHLKKAGRQQTGLSDCVVSKKNERRCPRWHLPTQSHLIHSPVRRLPRPPVNKSDPLLGAPTQKRGFRAVPKAGLKSSADVANNTQ